jgi:ubiquinone/menaquinone biosynthesis C-methylase UbiE
MPELPAVVADGSAMPFRDGCADLLCFAQSWHWLDEHRRSTEAARVLRDGGAWAAWWSHARGDGDPGFEAYWTAVEDATVARREERDTNWGADLLRSGLFDVNERITFTWLRDVTAEEWLEDQRSKSYVASLPEPRRSSLLAEVERIINDWFPAGQMQVPYETSLWTATKR